MKKKESCTSKQLLVSVRKPPPFLNPTLYDQNTLREKNSSVHRIKKKKGVREEEPSASKEIDNGEVTQLLQGIAKEKSRERKKIPLIREKKKTPRTKDRAAEIGE